MTNRQKVTIIAIMWLGLSPVVYFFITLASSKDLAMQMSTMLAFALLMFTGFLTVPAGQPANTQNATPTSVS